jgi:hypothetical protein
MVEPKWRKSRTDIEDPKREKLLKDRDEPRLVLSKTDRENRDPKRETPITDKVEPRRAKPRSDKEEPTCEKSIKETVDPSRT